MTCPAASIAQAGANRTSSDGAALPRCAVLDYPDVAIRGFRAWAAPIDQNNVSWTRGLVDLMSSYKLNFAPLPANANAANVAAPAALAAV